MILIKNSIDRKRTGLKIENKNNVSVPHKRKIILATIILFSVSLILIPSNVYANEISIASIGLEESTIITLTNDSTQDIKTLRIWLQEDFNFESFKTEKGWIGEKNQQGVIIFTSSETIKIGESVKFGIKTDKTNPIINWKVLNKENEIIETGVITFRSNIPMPVENSNTIKEKVNSSSGKIFSDSTFRIIPDKPNSGSTIRVTGDYFESSQEFDFYIDKIQIGKFHTDENGSFITTMKVPNIETNERVEFKIKNNQGQEKTMSLRLGSEMNRIEKSDNIQLTINPIDNVLYRGDTLDVFGTGSPSKSITIKIIDPEESIINTRTTQVDSTGNWKAEKINIGFDAEFGKYSLIISDGKKQILKNWNVESNKIIDLKPTKLYFKSGELIVVNGTSLPNTSLTLSLENNLDREVISEVLNIDESGFVEFEYQTTENDDKEGTWVLIATVGNEKEFIYIGYGTTATIPINFDFDKKNYRTSETAKIDFKGKPSEKITLIIISPTGTIKQSETPIQLRADGRGEYELKLQGYESGVYTAVIKKSGTQSEKIFSVGLQVGSGNIDAKITQVEYNQGDSILLLGDTNPNSLMTVNLMDPNGNQIKSLEVPSNNVGMFTEDRLKIPTDAIEGIWKIDVISGTNMDSIEFKVSNVGTEGLKIQVNEINKQGELLKIDIITKHKTLVTMVIKDETGQIIDKTITCNTTKDFVCQTFWPIPKTILPGTYILEARDSVNSNEITFDIILK